MILSVCMSPCLDVTLYAENFQQGKTNVLIKKTVRCGGKGINVATGVKCLGGEAHVTGIMYEDSAALFEEYLTKHNTPYTFAYEKGKMRENYKICDKNGLTELNDCSKPVTKQTEKQALALITELSKNSQVTLLSGSLPENLSPQFYGEMRKAVDKNSLVIVDATGDRALQAVECGAALIKPNLQELEEMTGIKIQDENSLKSACKTLIVLGAKRVLVSLGKNGAVITDGEKYYHCQSEENAVNSTVGAGDAMLSAVALALEKGKDLQTLLKAGVAFATAFVTDKFTKEFAEEIFQKLQVKEI